MKRLLFILPVIGFFVLLAVFFAGLGRDPTRLPSALIGKPTPAVDLPPLRPGDPNGLTTADLRGEPVLLNVWASWCVACRIEHPMLMRLRAEGVRIHGLDWKDEPAKGVRWLEQLGDPYVRVGADVSGRAGIDLGVSAAPETFVIDKQGRVRYRHVGAISIEDWERKIGPLMEKLKAES